MLRAGLVEHRTAPLIWCEPCETALARIQVEGGCCWRCDTPVATREMPQWTVLISKYVPFLRKTLDDLDGWSAHARRAVAALLDDDFEGARGQGGVDWVVSRQRAWGTPIPIVHCDACGAVPVPVDQLPVLLPDDLDWGSGSGALGRCAAFVQTTCPECEAPARRETDTLDCSFDDAWCYFQSLVLDSEQPGFTRENFSAWLPVDRSQSGRDTYPWFHLYRFVGVFLHEQGLLDDPHYIKGFFGHDLILAGGRKMSKHLGNAVNPDAILETWGADVLRVAMMWAAGPQRSLNWRPELLERSADLLDLLYGLGRSITGAPAAGGQGQQASKKARALDQDCRATIAKVTRFIAEVRHNAAVDTLAQLAQRIEAFAEPRLASGRLSPADAEVLRRVFDDLTIAVAPFAPHLAEELWALRGPRGLVAQARWPCGAM